MEFKLPKISSQTKCTLLIHEKKKIRCKIDEKINLSPRNKNFFVDYKNKKQETQKNFEELNMSE